MFRQCKIHTYMYVHTISSQRMRNVVLPSQGCSPRGYASDQILLGNGPHWIMAPYIPWSKSFIGKEFVGILVLIISRDSRDRYHGTGTIQVRVRHRKRKETQDSEKKVTELCSICRAVINEIDILVLLRSMIPSLASGKDVTIPTTVQSEC